MPALTFGAVDIAAINQATAKKSAHTAQMEYVSPAYQITAQQVAHQTLSAAASYAKTQYVYHAFRKTPRAI